MLALCVFAAAWLQVVVADFQFSDNAWTRIGYCNGLSNSSLDYDIARITAMARESTSVRICTMGSTVDCVTSNANSFPIQQLAAGQMLVSRTNAGTCCRQGPNCLRTIWTGPTARVNELMFGCGGGCFQGTDTYLRGQGYQMVYHACGNPNGMHFSIARSTTPGPVRLCSWGASNGGHATGRGRIELFIDFPQTTTTPAPTAPTAGPTLAPTPVWDPQNVERRVTDLESRLTASVSTLNAQISAGNSAAMAESSRILSTLTSVAVTADSNAVDQADLWVNVTQLNTDVSALVSGQSSVMSTVGGLVSALRAALRNATVGGGGSPLAAPRVSSTRRNDIVIATGATVQVSSGSCSNPDLCGAASFASALKQALQDALNR